MQKNVGAGNNNNKKIDSKKIVSNAKNGAGNDNKNVINKNSKVSNVKNFDDKQWEKKLEEAQLEEEDEESEVGNVQQLVLLFESKQSDDLGEVRYASNMRYSASFVRPESVCSGWSGVGGTHQVVQRRNYDWKDTESVSSVGSTTFWNRYDRQSRGGLDSLEGQSRLNRRGSLAQQVMVTRYANGGLEGVVIQNEASTISDTSSWSSLYNGMGEKEMHHRSNSISQDVRIEEAKEKFLREEAWKNKIAQQGRGNQERLLQVQIN